MNEVSRTISDNILTLHENIRKDVIPKSKFMLNGYVRRNTKDTTEKTLYWKIGYPIKLNRYKG